MAPSKHRPQAGERGCGRRVAAGRLAPVSDEEQDETGQLALMPELVRARARAAKEQAAGARRRRRRSTRPPSCPVARVLVDVPLAHLDRPFDYLVPGQAARAGRGRDPGQGPVRRPGRRRLRPRAGRAQRPRGPAGAAAPGGQRRAGAVARRSPGSPSWSPPATPAPAPTCCGWRSRAGTPPPRSSESAPRPRGRARRWPRPSGPGPALRRGSGLRRAGSREGGAPRAVWSALPGDAWPTLLAQAAAATYSSRPRGR